jgi:hypothetical protein
MIGIYIGAVVLLALSALVLWWASACRRGTFRRNHIAGYRTRFTLSSDAAWVAVHKAMAPLLRVAGIGGVIEAILASWLASFGGSDTAVTMIGAGAVWLFACGIILPIIPAHARARSLKHAPSSIG